ncbi:MAG TPA: hypothetical protein PLD88_06670, partial [Candidatus Berkiella sp.]|nr:hypothetical protein [Candidatus Berkiella sp.]
MTWAAFKDKFVQNVKYAGSLAASLFTAPYLRELFDIVVDNTIGRPTSPYAYVPYAIAREGFGYL